MAKKQIYVGQSQLTAGEKDVKGKFCELYGEEFYKISNYDKMPPFLMSIVSDSDHWMFLASTGGLTCGRENSENSLFPYYTEDKLIASGGQTGSWTAILVKNDTGYALWEPFTDKFKGVYKIERNLYKNKLGNKVVFEEINHDLNLCFRYSWMTSDQYGFVKKSEIINLSNEPVSLEVLDGIRNILPYGVTSFLQNEFSCLVDAYKKTELQSKDDKLGIFTLSSILTDKAEPNEALKATTVWSAGLNEAKILLNENCIDLFCEGRDLPAEQDIRGKKGAYFIHSSINLPNMAKSKWYTVAELNQDRRDICKIRAELANSGSVTDALVNDISLGSEKLEKLIGTADGLQVTADKMAAVHHSSNVMFNIMRGGVFASGYEISCDDFRRFIQTRNTGVQNEFLKFLNDLPTILSYHELEQLCQESDNVDLLRLFYEYLPLIFSRRHGDPSRPWNKFNIKLKDQIGNQVLAYQGNWRDIFQNWESLCLSFPAFYKSIICKFLNAMTVDGYNPYRVTNDGIDWEEPEPDNPWSNIGYWGDHQVVYLLKLFEWADKFYPKSTSKLLESKMFVYADIPYEIKPYKEILNDCQDTIIFNTEKNNAISLRVSAKGADGKLLHDNQDGIIYTSMLEKLLVICLAKLANYVPNGGIWMNTQRPEWNDANNALAGYGLSMVTLNYLIRFLRQIQSMLQECTSEDFTISIEVNQLLTDITKALKETSAEQPDLKAYMDKVGEASTVYRQKIYTSGFSGEQIEIAKIDVCDFIDLALTHLEQTVQNNQSKSGLYHSYNILDLQADSAGIDHLYDMLEGQVAAISSGVLSSKQVVDLLYNLFDSDIYREDQDSFMLYPHRYYPSFCEKNNIQEELISRSDLLLELIRTGNDKLVVQAIDGNYHFNGLCRNATCVREILEQLKSDEDYTSLAEQDHELVLQIYEEVFNHKSFTGRSGTFFAYEGLGSIYWHMVSKLLLAVQDAVINEIGNVKSKTKSSELCQLYYRVRAGLGFNKTPDVYGVFPMDPYSHTPYNSGARQPGMTGQVKEEIITRLGELGIVIENGMINFSFELLRGCEFTNKPIPFKYYNVDGITQIIDLPSDSLGFTICQVPFVYSLGTQFEWHATRSDNTNISGEQTILDADICRTVFERTGEFKQIKITIPESYLSQ